MYPEDVLEQVEEETCKVTAPNELAHNLMPVFISEM
jgi:hypothetical protein